MGIAHRFIKYVDLSPTTRTIAVIGAGSDVADLRYFCEMGRQVISFDLINNGYKAPALTVVQGDFNKTYEMWSKRIDVVWACHVLEHQRNVGKFLDNINCIMNDAATLYVAVPPYKPNIVGGHLSVWNMGLLMYNLCLAGFDITTGRFKKEGYNIFGIVKKSKLPLPALRYDRGDLEALVEHWNPQARLIQNVHGDIQTCNWFDT